jgi:hypothetical protein
LPFNGWPRAARSEPSTQSPQHRSSSTSFRKRFGAWIASFSQTEPPLTNTGLEAGDLRQKWTLAVSTAYDPAAMSAHSYSRCWIHLIWGTLNRKKLLNKAAPARVSRYSRESRARGRHLHENQLRERRSCSCARGYSHFPINRETDATSKRAALPTGLTPIIL